MKILHDDDYYERRKPQPDLGLVGNFMRFVWNKRKRTVLGRTAKEWGELVIFYFFFFSVLGSIFVIQMYASVRSILKLDRPYFQSYPTTKPENDAAGRLRIQRSPWSFASPGIVFRPSSPLAVTSPIIWVNSSNDISRPERYVRGLTEFLEEYKRDDPDFRECGGGNDGSKICPFDTKTLGACGAPPFGYADPVKPCVLIKFNKRFDWIPQCYNRESVLPDDMPEFLKRMIPQSRKDSVWLYCDGANSVDREHIGDISYHPSPEFPAHYFPFAGQPDYLSPIVALQFNSLTRNRLVTVECRIWAQNVREGQPGRSLDFQIMIG